MDFNPLLTPLPSCTNELQNSQGQAALHALRSVEVAQPCPWRLGKGRLFCEEVSRSGPTGLIPCLCGPGQDLVEEHRSSMRGQLCRGVAGVDVFLIRGNQDWESQNPGTIWGGRYLKNHLVPTLAL